MRKNKPSEPIVTRREGATFYCLACGKTYQKCKCRIYVSADTLNVPKKGNSGAANAQSLNDESHPAKA